jgi:hypothetical protein
MERGEHVRWFAREVLPHEADVRRWLARRVRGLPDCHVDEIVQEAYARLWATGPERREARRARAHARDGAQDARGVGAAVDGEDVEAADRRDDGVGAAVDVPADVQAVPAVRRLR